MGYFHEESWKPYNGWEGRDGGERELMLGRVWKGKGLRQGLLLTQGLWTQFWVSYLCWQFVTLAVREIRKEMFTEGFLWRGEGATRCYNYFSFSFSFEYSFPLSLGLLLPHFQGSPYPIKPQEADLGLVEQAGAQLQHCCVGTAALFAERSKGERENGVRCKQRGGWLWHPILLLHGIPASPASTGLVPTIAFARPHPPASSSSLCPEPCGCPGGDPSLGKTSGNRS